METVAATDVGRIDAHHITEIVSHSVKTTISGHMNSDIMFGSVLTNMGIILLLKNLRQNFLN